jgi:hypothetical protein
VKTRPEGAQQQRDSDYENCYDLFVAHVRTRF